MQILRLDLQRKRRQILSNLVTYHTDSITSDNFAMNKILAYQTNACLKVIKKCVIICLQTQHFWQRHKKSSWVPHNSHPKHMRHSQALDVDRLGSSSGLMSLRKVNAGMTAWPLPRVDATSSSLFSTTSLMWTSALDVLTWIDVRWSSNTFTEYLTTTTMGNIDNNHGKCEQIVL